MYVQRYPDVQVANNLDKRIFAQEIPNFSP